MQDIQPRLQQSSSLLTLPAEVRRLIAELLCKYQELYKQRTLTMGEKVLPIMILIFKIWVGYTGQVKVLISNQQQILATGIMSAILRQENGQNTQQMSHQQVHTISKSEQHPTALAETSIQSLMAWIKRELLLYPIQTDGRAGQP